jgi:tetratricopeptide (TPR) repeat protein
MQHAGRRQGGHARVWLAAAMLGLALATARADTPAEVRALAARGELPAALRLADRALAARPGDDALKFSRAVVLMDLQRDDEALGVFTELSQTYPELPDPHNNLALLHARAGRLSEALAALQTALRNDPSHRLARINLGQVHLMLAAQAWEQAAATAPLEPELRQRLEAVRVLLRPPLR